MKRDTLIDAIGKIDASFVEEAENWRKEANAASKPQKYKFFGRWQRILATAACLLLVSVSIFAALQNAGFDAAGGGEKTAGNSEGAALENKTAENRSDAALENETAGDGSEAATENEIAGNGSEAAIENGTADGGAMGGEAEEEAEITPGDVAEPEKDSIGAQESEQGITLIPEEITAVIVTHVKAGVEEQVRIDGQELEALREWADGLVIGPEVTFAEGAYPGADSEKGESFFFNMGEADVNFSYRNFGACYVVIDDVWYPVENPTNPPV